MIIMLGGQSMGRFSPWNDAEVGLDYSVGLTCSVTSRTLPQ